jgi:hypothetical protein
MSKPKTSLMGIIQNAWIDFKHAPLRQAANRGDSYQYHKLQNDRNLNPWYDDGQHLIDALKHTNKLDALVECVQKAHNLQPKPQNVVKFALAVVDDFCSRRDDTLLLSTLLSPYHLYPLFEKLHRLPLDGKHLQQMAVKLAAPEAPPIDPTTYSLLCSQIYTLTGHYPPEVMSLTQKLVRDAVCMDHTPLLDNCARFARQIAQQPTVGISISMDAFTKQTTADGTNLSAHRNGWKLVEAFGTEHFKPAQLKEMFYDALQSADTQLRDRAVLQIAIECPDIVRPSMLFPLITNNYALARNLLEVPGVSLGHNASRELRDFIDNQYLDQTGRAELHEANYMQCPEAYEDPVTTEHNVNGGRFSITYTPRHLGGPSKTFTHLEGDPAAVVEAIQTHAKRGELAAVLAALAQDKEKNPNKDYTPPLARPSPV